MKKFGKSAPEMSSGGFAQSMLVSKSEANGMMVDKWRGMASSKVALELIIWKIPNESLWIWMQLNSPILLDAFPTKTLEVSAKVYMNLGGIDVG
jgi:hypothetical protein